MYFAFDLESEFSRTHGSMRGYIDGLYFKSQPVQLDNQYYVYVTKTTNDIPVELKVEGINPSDSSFVLTNLDSNVARWNPTKGKIIVEGNGTFLIHYSSSNSLTLTPSTGDDLNDKKVRTQGTESCSPLVEYMVYEQEVSRQMILRSLDIPSLQAFGAMIFAGFGAIFSQFLSASKEGVPQINIPELILKAGQDEFGKDNVILQPGGSLGQIWTGRDTFPYSMLSDLEIEFYFDKNVFTNPKNMEYRVLSRFVNYAKSEGLNAVLNYVENTPGDPSSREVTSLKIVLPGKDGKVIPYDSIGSSYQPIGDKVKPTIYFGRGNFFGTEAALKELAISMDGYSIDDVKIGISQEYLRTLNEANAFSQYNEIQWTDDAHNFFDTPAKAYKKLILASKIRGDSIEIRNLLGEKFNYWDKVFRDQYKSTGSLSEETLQRFRASFDVVHEDFSPLDADEMYSFILKNLRIIEIDGHKIYILKNEVESIEDYVAFIDEVMKNYDILVTHSKTQSGIFDYIEDSNKRLNKNIDNKNIDSLKDLKTEISVFKELIPDDMENREVMIRTLNANMEAVRTAIETNLEITPDLEIKIYSANALTYATVTDGRLKIGDDVGKVKTDLDKRNYKPSGESEAESDEAVNKFGNAAEFVGSTVGDTAQKTELESLGKTGSSVLVNKVPDEATNPLSHVLERFGEVFSGTVGQITLSAGLIAIFSIGPLTREYAYKNGNLLLIVAADGIQIGGYLAVASVFMGQYAVTGSFWQAIISSTALLMEPMQILGSGKGILGLGTSIPSFIIFMIVTAVVNYIWCHFMDLTSSACGCSPNPAYGKAQLRLEKNVVAKGETIDFVIYGMQHCENQLLSWYAGSIYPDGWFSSPSASCSFLDGCCCHGVLTTSFAEGNHEVLAKIWGVQSRTVLFSTDTQTLTVCPTGYSGDGSENKCVTCDATTHTEVNNSLYAVQTCALQTSKSTCESPSHPYCAWWTDGCKPRGCEEGCGASSECDERIPNSDIGTGTCDSNCQYHPFINTGLGNPIIVPISPSENTGFKIYCPTNGEYDCIGANSIKGNPSTNCYWSGTPEHPELGWDTSNGYKGIFNCNGRTANSYTAECYANASTPTHCKAAQTEIRYSVYCSTGDTACCKSIGDMNDDNKVSLSDLVIFAQAYGSKPSDSKWNPNADINGDGIVSLPDLVRFAQHYGFNCYS
jgi:hypothetical protein